MTIDVTQVTVVGETTVVGVSGSITAPVVSVNVTATPVIQATTTTTPVVTVSAGIQGPSGPAGKDGNLNLPSQTSNSGKYLTTDGSNLSWASVSTGINLTNLSVVTTSPGTEGLSYNNTTGVFTFTPTNAITTFSVVTASPGTQGLGYNSGTGVFTFTPASLTAYALSSSLSTVATSGSYTDLTNKPTITPQIQSDWNQVVTSALDYIKNKPTIPSVPTYTISTAAASGGGSLSLTGSVFTFIPPNLSSYLTSITSSNVTTALGFTPYNATNPSNYITNTSLSVTNNAASGAGSLSYNAGVFTFTPAAAYTLPTASTLVLGGVKVDGTTISITNGVITAVSSAPNLTVTTNAAAGGGSLSYLGGVLTFTPPNLSSYLTSITSSNVTTALGFTPIQASSLSVATNSASGGGSLSYSNGVFTFTPAATYTLTSSGIQTAFGSSLSAHTFYAAPVSSTGSASFRTLDATDIPALNYVSLNGASTITDSAAGTNYTLKIAGTSGTGSVFGIGTGSNAYGIANDALNNTITGYVPYTISASTITFKTGTPTPATALSIASSGAVTIGALAGLLKGTSGVISAATAGTDYIAPYGSTTANYVLAAPNGSAGTPTFRALVASDIPALAYSSLTGTPTLATVATSGSYADLSNKPTIPSAYTLPTATTTVLGGVKIDGTTITIDGSGVISGSSSYTLPTASTTVLGGVKVDGTTITINGSGVISGSSSYTLPTASTTVLGGVKVDGTTITISNGVISGSSTYTLPTASGSVLGGIKIGTGLSIDGSGVVTASGSLPTQTGNNGKYLTTDGTTASWATVAGGSTFTGGTVANATTFQSNVTFSSSTAIIGDFDNAVTANRTLFTTATTNASTGIYAVPNGTSTSASWQALNNSTPTNASKILIAAGSTDVQLVSGINGSGTYLPLSFLTSGTTQMQLTTAGVLNVNAETINGTGMNLVYPSVGFNATYYTATAVTVTANNILAPDGATAGALITGSGASSTHAITVINSTYVATGFSTSTLTRTYSCYFQKGTNNFVQMTSSSDTTVYANFDLNNGVLGTVGAGCTAAISAVAGYAGWYRCSITTSNSSFGVPGFYLITTATAARAESNTLSTTIYAWGMQCEFGSAPRTYVPTTVAFVYGTPSLQINNNTVLSLDNAGSLNLGSSSNSTLALGTLSTAVNIATGLTSTTAQTVSIATGTNTGVKTINIGTGGGGTNITMGLASSGTTIINSASIQSGAATASLFTSTSSNISFATAATTLAIGSTGAGAVTTLNAPTVIGSNATQNLYNTVATTVNEFGVATAINVASAAASATTWTLGNSNNSNTLTVAGGASSGTASISTVITTGTVNLLTGVITGGTINIGGAGSNVAVGGYLTMPSRPAFRVIGNGGAIIATTTVTSTNWTLDFQQGTALNTTTGIFTAPVAGLYQVNLVMRANSNSSSTISQAIVIKNASTSLCMLEFAPNTTMNHAGVSTITQLAVGDTIKVVVAVGTLSFDGNDNWSVAFIG